MEAPPLRLTACPLSPSRLLASTITPHGRFVLLRMHGMGGRVAALVAHHDL